jgi:hypothetical protein
MSYFSSYFGERKLTKNLMVGRILALIECVESDIGIPALSAGVIRLHGNGRVSFLGEAGFYVDDGWSLAASVKLDGVVKRITSGDYGGLNIWNNPFRELTLNRLALEILNEVAKQSPQMLSVEGKITNRVGGYVFVGYSPEFNGAFKKSGDSEKLGLLRKTDKTHYVMETYESMGEATLRANKSGGVFPGGIVRAYQHLL